MANTIPCPNPTCTHGFSMEELRTATQLVCPKCGFRMHGIGASLPKAPPKPAPPAAAKPVAAPKPTAPPMATPVPPKPAAAKPVASQPKPAPPPASPSPPLATPIQATAASQPATTAASSSEQSVTDGMFFNPEVSATAGPLVKSNQAKRTFNWMRLLLVGLSIGFAVCLVVVGIGLLVLYLPGFQNIRDSFSSAGADTYIGKIRNSHNENEKVYKLVLPRKEWSVDPEMKERFNAHVAWKSNEYDFWFALVVQDFATQKPRDAEMLRIGIERLEGHFGEDLELAAKAEPIKFGELSAQKLQFRGTYKDARWLGECMMFFSNGVAYWLFTASPNDTTIEYFEEKLPENNIFVVSERRGWREQPAPVVTFNAADNKIAVTAPKGVWEKGNPKDDDENGVLLLAGKYKRKKDNRLNAIMLILALKKESDLKTAVKSVREYLDKGLGENYKIVQADDVAKGQSEIGSLEDIGNKRGRRLDLKLLFGEEPQRYYLLSVINDADACYAIVCHCGWESRQIWRQDFLDILGTVQVK